MKKLTWPTIFLVLGSTALGGVFAGPDGAMGGLGISCLFLFFFEIITL